MAAPSRRPLSPVDAAWYRMDWPNNPAVITGLLYLDAPVDLETARLVFAERLLDVDRFRSRVVERGLLWSLPYWETDPHFDIAPHVQALRGPGSGDESDLLDLVGDLASRPLPPDRPLWQAYVIDRGETSALVIRFHHCMADGTGSVALARHLLDPVDASASIPSTPAQPSLPRATSLFDRTRRGLWTGLRVGIERFCHPVDTLQHLPTVVEGVGIAAGSVLEPADPPTPLHGALNGTRRLAHTKPFPLADVKAIGRGADATVNDVLVAAVAGALRHYLLDHDTTEALPSLRAIVPVDLRPEGRALELGNAFGLTFLPLPVNETDPAARLRAAKSGMDAIKHSPEAHVFLGILGLFGQLPAWIEDAAADLFASKATAVLTNVTGPTHRHAFAGRTLEGLVFWVPHPVHLGLGISILSYDGGLTVGVMTDGGVVAEPSIIARAIEEEVTALQKRVVPVPA
ncbi:hypothetical protein BSZ35_12905 [Salinibacter sp. 10B]|uniref:wax ester/triacylglycerol synthase family O-acyltransferase n=1 Tax=Salinibacter sp. 10B TaxID=1923971 RepID=UPI000D298A0D|nr:wax ester/triacylglycerol synthase family O-acyltransferase [Salinibacter sp. 10B]PQJ36474.1 hypothetical protein BSZ35_12905 [Salinibacter sp. 10B]